MASTLFFGGRAIATPSSVIEIDASGLEPVGFQSVGIMAIIGEARGGVPVADIDEPEDLFVARRPEQSRRVYRSGDLREAADMAFNPSRDPVIPGGATEIVMLKLNPDTRSTGSLQNAFGDVIDLVSGDYGPQTNQISVRVDVGSSNPTTSELTEVNFESTTELGDVLGGRGIIDLNYNRGIAPLTTTWGDGGAVLASVLRDGTLDVFASKGTADLTAEVVGAWALGVAAITSTGADVGKVLTIYGLAGGIPRADPITLTGVAQSGTLIFTEVYGSRLSAPAAGAITVNATVMTYAATEQYKGLTVMQAGFVANSPVTFFSAAATAGLQLMVIGLNPTNSQVLDLLTIQVDPADMPSVGTAAFAEVQYIAVGRIDSTGLLSATAYRSSLSVQDTLQKLAADVNARNVSILGEDIGFDLTILVGGTQASPSVMDEAVMVDVEDLITPAVFTGVVQAMVDFYNLLAELVDAEISTFVAQVATLTFAAANNTDYELTLTSGVNVFRAGYRSDGSATLAEIQAGVLAAISSMPGMNALVTAAAGLTTTITLTFRTGLVPQALVATVAGFTGAPGAAAITTASVGARVAPTAPQTIFMTGGSTGVTTQADWDKAFELLRRVRVNTIVPLTGDPSIHAQLEAHCQYMSTLGKSERDALVGLSALDGSSEPLVDTVTGFPVLPNKQSILNQLVDLNSRHIRACAQNVDKFHSDGTRRTFPPWFQAVIGAGMQSGAALGEPLTFKYANVLKVSQDGGTDGWNPEDDSDEMIQGGLWFMQNVRGVGRRVVRNITTHLTSNNLAFTEGSVNQVVNFVSFELRLEMEAMIGRRGLLSTLKVAKARAQSKLNGFLDLGTLVAWRSLTLSLNFDILEVSVEIAPVLPINFVRTTLHLVAVPLAA